MNADLYQDSMRGYLMLEKTEWHLNVSEVLTHRGSVTELCLTAIPRKNL